MRRGLSMRTSPCRGCRTLTRGVGGGVGRVRVEAVEVDVGVVPEHAPLPVLLESNPPRLLRALLHITRLATIPGRTLLRDLLSAPVTGCQCHPR